MKHVTTTDADIGRAQALSLLRSWYLKTPIKHAGSSISNRCAAPHSAHGVAQVVPYVFRYDFRVHLAQLWC